MDIVEALRRTNAEEDLERKRRLEEVQSCQQSAVTAQLQIEEPSSTVSELVVEDGQYVISEDGQVFLAREITTTSAGAEEEESSSGPNNHHHLAMESTPVQAPSVAPPTAPIVSKTQQQQQQPRLSHLDEIVSQVLADSTSSSNSVPTCNQSAAIVPQPPHKVSVIRLKCLN